MPASSVGAPRGARTTPAYDGAHKCVTSTAPAGYTSAWVAGDPYEVLGDASTIGYARIYQEAASRRAGGHAIWQNWTDYLRASPLTAAARYQIFIVPRSELPIPLPFDGATVPYCGLTVPSAVVIPVPGADIPTACLTPIFAHELFHAFQAGVEGHLSRDTWWDEATAAYAELLAAPCRDLTERQDIFLPYPQVPLDVFSSNGGDDPKRDHAYGVFRFVEWLNAQIGAPFWDLLRDSFARIGRGEDPTQAVVGAEEAQGRKLGDDLAAFWASRMRPDGPGPRTEGNARLIGVAHRDRLVIHTDRLAAKIVRFHLKPAVRQVRIKAPRPASEGHVWVETPRDGPFDWTAAGGEADFCVGDAPNGYARWPGEFALAFTTGASKDTAPTRSRSRRASSAAAPRPAPCATVTIPPRSSPTPTGKTRPEACGVSACC